MRRGARARRQNVCDHWGRSILEPGDCAKIDGTVEPEDYLCGVTQEQFEESMSKSGAPDWMIRSLLELSEISRVGQVARVSTSVEGILHRKPLSL